MSSIVPSSPPRPCSRCGLPVVRGGFCAKHYRQADMARGTSQERGYGQRHRDMFRSRVLANALYRCVLCGGEAVVADHFPRTRKQLLAAGDDPDNPAFGRALCKQCHDRHTAASSIARPRA